MSGDLPFLGPGPLPLGAAPGVTILAALGRVGDGLVYAGRVGDVPVRIREYAPAGIVRRLPDGSLHPVEARFAAAWDEALAAFLDKGARLAAIDHYGLARIARVAAFDGDGVRQGGVWIGAPTGAPLAATLPPGQQRPPAEIMRYAAELADTLAVLHARGLAHLDIAPETATVADGWLVLTDPAVDNRAFMPLLGSQDGLVRPNYTAIEQCDAQGAETPGAAADIHAASALLHRLIEGRPPPPWPERWRDAGPPLLPDRAAYPPAFLAALRKGLAVEPADRFRDGGAWQAALGLAPAAAAISAPRAGGAPAFPPPPRVTTGSWLVPLLVALAILALAAFAFVAYQQRWFTADRDPASAGNMSAARPPAAPKPAPADEAPRLAIGGSVAGRLTASDRRAGAGRYEDRYTLVAAGGERLVVSLAASEFDPTVAITGPGFEAMNDDAAADVQDSRLAVTLPRAGRYTITVSSYDRGETGAYRLQVASAAAVDTSPVPVPDDDGVSTIDLSAATRLSGRWHAPGDDACAKPAVNAVLGDRLTSAIGDDLHSHRILGTDGNLVRTVAVGGPARGRSFTFRLADDGASYAIAGETWLRC